MRRQSEEFMASDERSTPDGQINELEFDETPSYLAMALEEFTG
jgi:hypothetical protein